MPLKPNIASAILWVFPIVQSLACMGFALAGSKLGFAIQSRQRGPGPAEALIGLLMVAMHAGYFLAPLWCGSGRKWWAVLMMVPIALIVFGATLFLFREALSGDGTSGQMRTAAIVLAVEALLYAAPIVIVAATGR